MRTTSQLLLFVLMLGAPALVGCFGEGGSIFDDDTHLMDSYGSGGTPVRGAYALGSVVEFFPDFADEDVGAATDIVISGTALVETSRSDVRVVAEALEEGSGEITFSLRGIEEESIRYDVLAADTLAFRRVFDSFGREDVSFDLVFAQGDTQAEVVIDYYAGSRRLFGHAIATAGEGGTVSPTTNNDRLRLDTSIAGDRSVDLSLVGGGTAVFEFSVVDSIASVELTQSMDADSIRFTATASDAMGRAVRSPIEWRVDGAPMSGSSASISLMRGSVTRTVTARLLDAEAAVTANLQ